MGQGANILFNLITIIFLVLTVAVGAVIIGVLTDSMDPPILAPEDTAIPPTSALDEGGGLLPTATITPGGPADDAAMDQTLTPEAPAQ